MVGKVLMERLLGLRGRVQCVQALLCLQDGPVGYALQLDRLLWLHRVLRVAATCVVVAYAAARFTPPPTGASAAHAAATGASAAHAAAALHLALVSAAHAS